MFEKFTQLAEATATRVSLSRRGFVSRLGQGALAVGALLAGFAAPAAGQTGVVCCKYRCNGIYKIYGNNRTVRCQAAGTTCAPFISAGPELGCHLTHQTTRATCNQC